MKEVLGYITEDGKAYQALFKIEKADGMLRIKNTFLDIMFSIPEEEVKGEDENA